MSSLRALRALAWNSRTEHTEGHNPWLTRLRRSSERAFDSFRRSAFRLELLDRYVAANEAEPLRRFRSGQQQDPAWREPWKQYVRAALRDGKQLARVHVVTDR